MPSSRSLLAFFPPLVSTAFRRRFGRRGFPDRHRANARRGRSPARSQGWNHDRLQRESAGPQPGGARRRFPPSFPRWTLSLRSHRRPGAHVRQLEGLNPDYVRVFPGSSPALTFTVITFTSPQRSYVTADPGYEAGMFSAKVAEARVVKVPLTRTYAHDVKAMVAAAPDAGLFYICNPNNPTGTLTPHSDLEYSCRK